MESDALSEDNSDVKQFAIDFWEKLTAAARRDGRLLDPLWRDLADEDEISDNDEINAGGNDEGTPSAFYTTKIVLTNSPEEDQTIYDNFRADFSIFPIKNIPHSTYLEGDTWDALLQEQGHTVEYPDAPTPLRTDALGMFSTTETALSEGLLEVPRIKFLFIEVTRIKEEMYDKSFRQKLELFDMKTQSDLLESSLTDPSMEAVALQSLKLLRTQWPNPSLSVLKKTGVVKVLRRGAKSGSTESIRTGCQHIFSSWRDLRDLGRVREAWHIGGDDVQRLRPILEKAGEALVKDLTLDHNGVGPDSSSNPQMFHDCRQENGITEHSSPTVEELTIKDTTGPKSVATAFGKHGVVFLPDYLTSVSEYLKEANDAFEALVIEQLEPRGLSSDGSDKFVLMEAQQQPGYRIDNRYGFFDDPDSPIAKLGQRLSQEIPSLLFPNQENDFCLAKTGVLHARPRRNDTDGASQPQMWRRDGAPLFAGNNHHPTHCLNLFIPLVDIPAENGNLEFVPGTHMNKTYEAVVKDITSFGQQNQSAKHELALRGQLHAGTIVACDVRILHRSRVNRSLQDQPILYFTFAKNWFREQERTLQSRHNKSLQDPAVHIKLVILTRLRQMVTGTSSLRLVALDETYGHPHYTDRFDLLLLDCLLSEDPSLQSAAMVNMAAVIHFCTLSEGDKETTAREFLYAFSQRNHYRKIRVLENTRQKRHAQEEDTDSTTDDIANLYDLAASILMEESTLLAKLGFSSDEHGVCCLLAMLKAHATRHALGCIGITENDLDEAFTSWWHTGQGRFMYLPGCAESAEERANRKVLVIFSGLGGGRLVRPEWSESLEHVISDPRLDVMHVIDPSFSFYCQDPQCLWKGCDYYISELDWRLSNYQAVMFFGASAGGTAALRFSTMADKVLVISPVVDILSFEAIPRSDFPEAVKEAFQQSLLEILREGETAITVHYSESCNVDAAQVQLLPKRQNIQLTPCYENDHQNAPEHLNNKGALLEVIETDVRGFLEGSMTRRRSVLVGSF